MLTGLCGFSKFLVTGEALLAEPWAISMGLSLRSRKGKCSSLD